MSAQAAALEGQVASTREALAGAEAEVGRLEADRDRYREQVAELQSQVGAGLVTRLLAAQWLACSLPAAGYVAVGTHVCCSEAAAWAGPGSWPVLPLPAGPPGPLAPHHCRRIRA